MYDYLIIGSGLYGAVFAHQKQLQGKKCLVLEKRGHIGGNIYSKVVDGIDVHCYGPHIFNTSNKKVWSYLSNMCDINCFQYEPKASFKGKLYTLPFNLNTISEIYGINDPLEARRIIESSRVKIENPSNLEEFALSQVGPEIYEKLIYGYTKKQWKKDPKELPAFIIKRLPVRFNFNNSYFDSRYQGIPDKGYSEIIQNMLRDAEVKLNTEFELKNWKSYAKKLVFTGQIDSFFDFRFGDLEYRSLSFDEQVLDIEDFQGNPVINYTEEEIPYTRVIEHKHFNPHKMQSKKTVVTYEYPSEYIRNKTIPYYPINTFENTKIYEQYRTLANDSKDILISGRLGLYCYLNMDQVCAIAMTDSVNF